MEFLVPLVIKTCAKLEALSLRLKDILVQLAIKNCAKFENISLILMSGTTWKNN